MEDFIEDDLISFETAKFLKEKGFRYKTNKAYSDKDDKCGDYCYSYDFNNDAVVKEHARFPLYAAVPQSILQKWLREKHGIHIWVESGYSAMERYFYQCPKLNDVENKLNHWADSYPEAMEKAFKEALKLI